VTTKAALAMKFWFADEPSADTPCTVAGSTGAAAATLSQSTGSQRAPVRPVRPGEDQGQHCISIQ